MSSSFVVHPSSIKRSAIIAGRVSLSPSAYREILKPKSTKRMSSLIKSSRRGKEIGSDAYMPHSSCRFLRTANIGESFMLDKTTVEYCKKCPTAIQPKDGTILVAKDGGGQGLGACCVYEANGEMTDYISAGVLSLEFDTEQDRNYVLAVLKSPHFKEYIDVATPVASTIRHSKLLTLDYDLPWSQDASRRQVISDIVANILDKERRIAEKNAIIDKLIAANLASGIKAGASKAPMLSRTELLSTTRLDAGMYADLVRETDNCIRNYRDGFYCILDYFKVVRGQNLQVSSIGESYYSNTPKQGFYRLFTTAEMTNQRTVTGYRWLGNSNRLSTLPKECIMLAAKGTVGRSIYFDELPYTITNIDQWVITAKDSAQPRYRKVFLSLFLSYLKNIGYLDKIKDKSNGGGLTKKPIEKWIKIPSFPDSVQDEIASYYYKDAKPLPDDATLDEVKTRNGELGIFQLNMETLSLREHLDNTIRDVILNG